jgi:RHS repeat-associated protein
MIELRAMGTCANGDTSVQLWWTTFACMEPHPTPWLGHSLTTDELDAYTGLPWGDIRSVYPNWPCVPSVPGPWLVNACHAKPEPEPEAGCSEQADLDPAACIGDPIDITTGHLEQSQTDLDLGHGLRFTRHYSSNKTQLGPLGRAWEHGLQWSLVRQTITGLGNRPIVFVHPPLHAPVVFVGAPDGSGFLASQRGDGALEVDPDGTVRYTAPTGTVATFSASNQLVSIRPPGEPLITVSVDGTSTTFSNGQQALVVTTHPAGHVDAGRVASVSGGGQTWTYTYLNQSLRTVTGPDPSDPTGTSTLTWTYAYTSSRLTSITRSDRPTTPLASWSYSSSRVSAADEPALDQPVTFSYQYVGGQLQTTVGSAGGPLAVFQTNAAAISTVTNPAGPPNPTPGGADPVPGGPGVPVPFVSGTSDPQGRWRTKVDKNGNVRLQEAYDARGKPGRIVEGWIDADASGTFDAGDGSARRREYVYHPTLGTPTVVTEASALTGFFGERVTVLDHDDPADDPAPAIRNSKPTPRVYQETLTGKTLDASGATVPLTIATAFGYDADGRLTSVSGPRPESYTQLLYDPATGYRTAIRRYLDGPGSVYLETTFSEFDARGNPQTVTDPNGRSTSFGYDALSRVRTATPPYPASEQIGAAADPTISFTFDPDGNLTRVDFPPDSAGQPVFLRMGYDTKNRLTFLADPQGNAIVYDFTAGRATRESRHTGFVDLANRGTRVGDADFAYDSAGRLVRAFNPLFADDSVSTVLAPDGNGNPVAITDENGKEDALVYDALDRLAEIQQLRSATWTTSFGYDALSNVTSVTDAVGKTTDLVHDDGGRLVKVDSPDTGTTLFLYDAAGNLVQKVEDSGGAAERTTTYAYDGLDRLLEIDLPNDPDWVFAYDTDAATNQKGRLASVTNGVVTTELEYTRRGDVAVERTIVDGLAYEVRYGYDAAGNRATQEGPRGSRVETRYAGLRPSELEIVAGAASEEVQGLAWYPFGPRTAASFPPADGSGDNTVLGTRAVNLRGQIEELEVTAASGAILDRSYRYDSTAGSPGPDDPGPSLDQVIDHLDPSESRFYLYDELDRLSAATDLSGTALHGYGYDAAGNRTSQQGPAGPSALAYESGTNRLDAATGAEARDYAHDAYGNRIYEGASAFAGTPSLVYDDANRLVEAKDPAADFATLGSYAYDAFGRRVKKVAGGKTVLFFYDTEGHLVAEVEKVAGGDDRARLYVFLEDELVAVVDEEAEVGAASMPLGVWLPLELAPGLALVLLALASGALVAFATRRLPAGAATAGSGVGLLLVCASGGSGPSFSWVHTDPLGTPLAVTGTPALPADVEAIWRARYAPFGRATVDEDPDADQARMSLKVRFPGQYEDAETGWHSNFYRTYDPSTGRYLEADPIGPVEMIERELENRRGFFDPILRVARPSGSMRGNLYAYALGDPLNLVDRDGADPETPSQPVDLPPAARRAFAAGRKASPQFREPYCTSGYTGCMSACSDEVTQAEQEFCLHLRLQCLQAPSATRSQPPQTTNHEGLYNGSRSLNKISVGRGPKVPNQ